MLAQKQAKIGIAEKGMFKTRDNIRDFIVSIENKFPVDTWKIDNTHIWPLIRIQLFSHLINNNYSNKEKITTSTKSIKKSKFKVYLSRIKSGVKTILCFYNDNYQWFRKLNEKKYLFLGADSHRVNYKNKRYNRYFDTWIDTYNLKDKSNFIEYDRKPISEQYNSEIIVNYHNAFQNYKAINSFFSKKNKNTLIDENYEDFKDFLIEKGLGSFVNTFLIKNIENRFSTHYQLKIDFFSKVLTIIKPKKIFILCYYSTDMMALTVAANKLNIETIEMQHGPLADLHLAYGSWTKIPKEGYDMLPRTYWCWDENSRKIVNNLSEKSKIYSSEVIGNPWVNYWMKNNIKYKFYNFILFSVQPLVDNSFSNLIPNQLIEIIKETNYLWFIRLHPRQNISINDFKAFFNKKGIIDKINLIEATNDPLPLILKNTRLHITQTSGVTLEANYFNVQTILIDKLGAKYYSELTNSKKALYIDKNSTNFKQDLLNIINNHTIPLTFDLPKNILKDYFKEK